MNNVLFHLDIGSTHLVVTAWKLVGYVGVSLFAGRWVVQLLASRVARRPVIPRLFWYMSLSGSGLLLTYFVAGKNDSVGILSNLFPTFTAAYNLWLDVKAKRAVMPGTPDDVADAAEKASARDGTGKNKSSSAS